MREHRGGQRAGALLALAGTMACFASIPVFLKHFAPALDAWTVNGLRYACAAVWWMPFVVAAWRRKQFDRGLWQAALAPTAVNVISQATFALSPYYNDAAVVGFVQRLSFLFALLFGYWLLPRERPLARQPVFWTGAAVTLAGLGIMYAGGVRAGATTPFGLALLLTTAAAWGWYTVLVARNLSAYAPHVSFGVISLYTAAALIALMFVLGDWHRIAAAPWSEQALLGLSALIGIAWGHVLLYRAIRGLGPILAEGGLLLIPFLTVWGAHVFLGERMGRAQWLGGCVMIAGSFLLLRAKRGER